MCRLWAYADTRSGSYGGLVGMKGETAEGFFLSQERSSGLTQNMRQTVTVVERYLRLRKRSDRFVTGHLVFRKKEGGNQ